MAEDAVVTYRTVVLVSLQRKVQTEGSDSREDGFCTSPWYKLQNANGGSVPTMLYIYYMFLYRIIWYIIVQHYLRYRSTVLDYSTTQEYPRLDLLLVEVFALH